MENVYSEIGKLLKEWRESQGFSLYKVAKEGSGKARYDYLKRLENGMGVNATTMICYLDFCYEHGFNVLEKLYNQKQLQPLTEAEKTTEKEVFEAPVEEKKPVLQEPPESKNDAPEEENREPTESEMDEWDYGYAVMKFNEGTLLDEEDQLQFIKNGRCPKCGKSQFVKKESSIGKTYTKCQDYSCGYWFRGTINNPTISEDYQKGVKPLRSQK